MWEEWDKSQLEEDQWQVPDRGQTISQNLFCGRYLEIHPSCSECISRSCTQHQGGRCSILEGRETQMSGKDKEPDKDQLPASSGRMDYLGKRLSQADCEMEIMFSEDRRIQMDEGPSIISINPIFSVQ